METRPLNEIEKTALISLLDDASPSVRQSLSAHFAKLGEAGRQLLIAASKSRQTGVATGAAWYLRELKVSDPAGDFRAFIQSLNYELESGVLLLSRTVNPDLDVAAVHTQLDAFAARARQMLPDATTLRGKCEVLNRVLFEEYGLRGNREHYTDPRNSFIEEVLQRRTGIPISLAVIYLLVAQRAGVELEPVGVPGHFLVGGYEQGGPFFVDAFNEGMILTPEDVFARLRAFNHEPQLSDLAPTPVREVLCRACRNLVGHYSMADEPARAEMFSSFVAEFEATYERHAQS